MTGSLTRSRRTQGALCAVATVSLIAMVGCSATGAVSQPGGGAPTMATAIPSQDGPGVTKDTVTISWGTAASPSTLPPPQQKQQAAANAALIEAFNKEGGIGGRKIRLAATDPGAALIAARSTAYAKSNFLPVPDPSNGKAACDAYASGDVFALLGSPLVNTPYGTPAAGACLNRTGHPVVGVAGWTRSDYDAAPATAGLTIDPGHFIDAVVAAGKDSGLLDAPAKTAVITGTTDSTDVLNKLQLPALAKAGVTDPLIVSLKPTLTPAEALSATIKMKSAGIERVILLASDSAGMSTVFLPAFQQQAFSPKILSVGGINFQLLGLIGQVKLTPDFVGTVANYEWAPNSDTVTLSEAQLATPGGKLWNQVQKANPSIKFLDLRLADSLQLLKAALEASGSEYINAQAFATGLDKLADFKSPRLFATSFGPDRHDGAAGIVKNTYAEACKCGRSGTTVIPF